MPEALIGALLVVPLVGALTAAWLRRGLQSSTVPIGLCGVVLLQWCAVLGWLSWGQDADVLTWPFHKAGSTYSSITMTIDLTRAFALLTTASALGAVLWSPSEKLWSLFQHRCGWWVLCLANLFWLSDDHRISLLAQAGLLGVGCLWVAWSSPHASAPVTARQMWITLTCGDVVLWAMALWWFLQFQTTSWSAGSRLTDWQGWAESAPVVVTTCGLALWCGVLARGLQFPLGSLCDRVSELDGRACGLLFGIILAPIGWRYLSAASPVFWLSPESYHLVQGAAMLSAGLSAWFSLCSVDPRVKLAWLGSWQGSFVIAALLTDADTGPRLSLLLWTSGLCVIAVWFGLWVTECDGATASAATSPAEHESTVEEPVIFSFTSWQSGRQQSFSWSAMSRTLQQAGNPFGRTEAAPAVPRHVTAVGGPGMATCLSLLLALGPLAVCAAWPVGTVLTNRPDESKAIASSPMSEVSLGSLLALTAGLWALTRLVMTTQRATIPASARLWCLVGVLPLVPWLVFGVIAEVHPGWARVSPNLQTMATGIAVLVGIVCGWAGGSSTGANVRRTSFETLKRLGQRRLYVSQLWLLGLNLPLRAAAQLLRFLDWFLIDGVLLKGMGWLLSQSRRSDDDLHPHEAGFYALSVGMGALAVAFTLMWLSQ
ncbi:hypothetical protein GC163_07055 [bacterium]|nr:hypothetical protein [bacterium]